MENTNNYYYDLILNIGGEPYQAFRLKERYQNLKSWKGRKIKILNAQSKQSALQNGENAPLTTAEMQALKRLDNRSRLSIIDHGYGNGTTTTSSGITAEWYSDQIANMNQEKLKGNTNLRINLIICNGAGGEYADKRLETKNSFAAHLHAILATKHELNRIEVVGREGITYTGDYTPKHGKLQSHWNNYSAVNTEAQSSGNYPTNPLVFHQKPGSKIAFLWNINNEQVAVDAYCLKAIRETNALLKEVDSTKLSPKSRQELTAVRKKTQGILDRSPEEITYKNALYFLETIRTLKNRIFSRKQRTHCEEVVSRCLQSIGTDSKDPQLTGRKFYKHPLTQEKRELWVQENVIDVVQDPLKAMPKTDRERPFKRVVQRKILRRISAQANSNLKHGKSMEAEEEIAKKLNQLGTIVKDNQDSKNNNVIIQVTTICQEVSEIFIREDYNDRILAEVDQLREAARNYVGAPNPLIDQLREAARNYVRAPNTLGDQLREAISNHESEGAPNNLIDQLREAASNYVGTPNTLSDQLREAISNHESEGAPNNLIDQLREAISNP